MQHAMLARTKTSACLTPHKSVKLTEFLLKQRLLNRVSWDQRRGQGGLLPLCMVWSWLLHFLQRSALRHFTGKTPAFVQSINREVSSLLASGKRCRFITSHLFTLMSAQCMDWGVLKHEYAAVKYMKQTNISVLQCWISVNTEQGLCAINKKIRLKKKIARPRPQ